MRPRVAIVVFACAVAAGGSMTLGGCGRNAADPERELVAEVVQAYMSQATSVPRHARPEMMGKLRCEKLAAAFEEIIEKHAAAPASTLNSVRELRELCVRTANIYGQAAGRIRPGQGLPPEWHKANRLMEEFETRLRALPGAEDALKAFE